ncbi:MAG: hypothetical protein KAT15_18860, partial [Bacteroidales bacterium]|nr:hypothetical protein [Bacteroidales bacterium]
AVRGSWQFSFSYDYNRMTTLMEGNREIVNDSRKRFTHSFLLETAWSITDNVSLSGLFTWVSQTRTVVFLGNQNTDQLHGIGDAIILLTWKLIGDPSRRWELLAGIGPKIPLGKSDMRSSSGYRYNADLQPGSGAWDGVGWGLLSRSGLYRPTSNLSLRFIYRYTGTNNNYLGHSSYRFGNELQLIAGISDQLILGSQILDPSILLRFRMAGEDKTGGDILPNTGGRWLYLIPGLVYHPGPRIHVRLAGEIPIYNYLEGIQLTSDFRITTGIYFRIDGRKENII